MRKFSPLIFMLILCASFAYGELGLSTVSPANTTYYALPIDFNVTSTVNVTQCVYSTDALATNTSMAALNTTYYYNSSSSLTVGNYTTLFWCYNGTHTNQTTVSFVYATTTTTTTTTLSAAESTCENIKDTVFNSFELATVAIIVLAAAAIIGILMAAFGGSGSGIDLKIVVSIMVVAGVMLVIGVKVLQVIVDSMC